MTETDHLKATLAQMIRERERIKSDLRRHLSPEHDPCQDRGVDWPCDVASALLPELDRESSGPTE